MSRYSFDPKLDPRRDKNRRMAIGAASISAAAIVGVGLIVVGCRTLSSGPGPTPTPANKPSIGVTIFAPQTGQQPTAASGETPATPSDPSAPAATQAPTQPPTPMDPRGKVEGIDDFSCPGPRPAPDTFGYGIQSNWPVGDIGYWNSVMADQLKVNWTKAQVRWKDFEMAKGKDDTFKWQLLDAFTADANKKGLNIVYGVLSTPNWARSVQEREGRRMTTTKLRAL
ncbi:MAG: hypothetical protein HC853_09300 [Anaerolineae bacterium]|nr:hypothetical protein [Anaerolineae bacterium]